MTFIEAKQKCKILNDEQTAITGEEETNQSLLHNKSGNGLIGGLKASKNTITDMNLVQDGDSTRPPGQRIHLRHHNGNRAATGSQIEAGIRGKHHPGLNSIFPSLFRDVISLAGNLNLISWQSTGCVDRHTYRASHFLMHSCCTDLFLLVVRVYSHTLTSMHLHGSSHEAHCLRFTQKHSHHILVAHCRTPCRTRHHARALLPRLFPESVFQQSNPAKINGHSSVAP